MIMRTRIPALVHQILQLVSADRERARRRRLPEQDADAVSEAEPMLTVPDALLELHMYEGIATYGFTDVRAFSSEKLGWVLGSLWC
jgi:hypothetical protein